MSEIENKELTPEKESGLNFVEQMVADDLKNGKNGGRLNTRFPPEPNGYLHIGHAKAICMDFGVAEKFGGTCNLRFDDTNPVKEDVEYVDSIREDIKWLGYDWGNREYYASDYFPQLYDLAIRMIKEGKAYVDEQTAEQIAEQKGTPTQPGTASPFRDRPIEENLDLFQRMNAGEFDEGAMVLRAKSTWRRQTCISATRLCTASSSIHTTAPAKSGKCTPCTTSPTDSLTISRV